MRYLLLLCLFLPACACSPDKYKDEDYIKVCVPANWGEINIFSENGYHIKIDRGGQVTRGEEL